MSPLPSPNPSVTALPQPKPITNRTNAPPSALLLHLGEAWYEPAPAVGETVAQAGASVARYPDSLCQDLRAEITRYVGGGVQPAQVIVGNGSDGLIDLIVRTYANPERPVLAPGPTFFAYGHAARLQGAPLLTAGRTGQAEGFTLALSRLPSTPGVLFLANPNNPTGETLEVETLRALADQQEGLVVIDECYFEFAGRTALSLLATHPHVIILRSLSKSFALAGLRVGYAVAHPEIIAALERADQTFTVNAVAQAAGVAALQALNYYEPLFQKTAALREDLKQHLEQLGLRVFPSAANILLVDYSQRTTENVAAQLRERHIYVADFHERGEVRNCFRIAISDAASQAQVIATLRELLT